MSLNKTLKISEIFSSIQGESSKVGIPSTFIRLTGCPLRCVYCDTAYAFTGGNRMSFDEIIKEVVVMGNTDICITGGEPLAQIEVKELLKKLVELKYDISLETSGAISIKGIDPYVKIIMDIKTPDSGEEDKNDWCNIPLMKESDEFKFVICSNEDYEWSKMILSKYSLDKKSIVLFSPCTEKMHPGDLADLILKDHLKVRFQMQLHKILWGNIAGK